MTPGKQGRGLYHNLVSYAGGMIVVASALLIIFSFALQYLMIRQSPYIGIFTFLVFPGILTIGALIFLYGLRRESVRRRRMGPEAPPPYPDLDLNDPAQRRKFSYAMLAGFFLLVLLAVVAYNAFNFTESVTFCGRICHTVMQPEYTAYLASPHARVRCVDCHVGSGASWFVKSKLAGIHQVLAVTFHTYQTPIPVPIKNLRPARETCEECHWPQKFYGAQLVQNPHFRYDEKNTAEQISLLVKTGGGSPSLGHNAGIHWHMIIENKVEFAAIDPQLQKIPWIKVTGPGGKTHVYFSDAYGISKEKAEALPRHVMDCMDCHNRPTHIFQVPDGAIDTAMASGLISPEIPWIKKIAVDALERDYSTRAAAAVGLRKEILDYYAKNYPAFASSHAAQLDDVAARVVDIYDRSVFPKMNVNWKTYATNIGHRNWPGCFRCHDARHVNEEGQVLTRACTTCHTMPQRGPLTPIGTEMPASSENWHPWELKGKHAEILCNRCHAAGFRPPGTCAGCHKFDTSAPMMSEGCDNCHLKEQQVKPLADCKTCHDGLPGLHNKGGHPDAECTDCHKPHVWKVTGRDICMQCHDDKANHYPGKACASCHDFTSNAPAKTAQLPSHLVAAHGA